MKLLYNNFFKALSIVILSLCVVFLSFSVLLIDYHNSNGQFYSSILGTETAFYESNKIMSNIIFPYLDSNSGQKSIKEIQPDLQKELEEIDYLDKNYHFVVTINDEVIYTDFKDFSSVIYISAINHSNYDDYLSNSYYEIIIENYINKELIKEGNLYSAYCIFNAIDTNFDLLIIILCLVVLIALIAIIHLIITSGCKDTTTYKTSLIDNLYFEILIIAVIVISELLFISTSNLISATGMIIEGIKTFIIAIIIIIMLVSLISRIRNKIFMKKSIIGLLLIEFKKIFIEVFKGINSKLKAVVIITTTFFIEAFILFYGFFEIEINVLLWILFKIVEFLMLMLFYSNICKLRNAAKDMNDGISNVKIDTHQMHGISLETAIYMNDIFTGLDKAIAEKLKSEHLKTELITNVSHDLKTPLTSIINYVDLIKKEEPENPKIKEYLEILDNQSMRLKKLTEDVIEASKAATGNIKTELAEIDVSEMITQALGEYEIKFNNRNLSVVFNLGNTPYFAIADGRLLWRVIDNLFSNICKYALEGTRVYIDIDENENYVIIAMKNISKYQLNISSDELMQRFVRGDSSRSTSGNGLGLSIAQSLIELQNGDLKLDINGDLFTAYIYLVKSYKDNLTNTD